MVMFARKQPRIAEGCNDRRDCQSYQSFQYQSKSHSANDHRHEKLHNSSDQTPPAKMLRRSDSPDSKQSDGPGYGHARALHAQRPKESSTSSSPQENSLNHAYHSANSHSAPNKCAEMPREPADDWSEHISSSGKKYYYNCRTEVSQWEKPKDWLEREQRQKEASKTVVNNFPKDRDYRQEAMQAASAISSIKPTAADKPSSHPSFSQASSCTSNVLHSSGASSSSTSTTTTSSPALQSHASALLQDPALLRQLLPALQATLQINNSTVDMAKINEVLTAAVTQASLQSMLHKILTAGPAFNITTLLSQAAQLSTQAQQSGQSPMSETPDTTSPRSYVSPRVSTPQTNTVNLKPLHNSGSLPAQPKVSESVMKSGSILQHSSGSLDRGSEVEDPRLQRQNSQGPLSAGPNGCLLSSIISSTPTCPPTTFTPSLALHFNENLIRHVQSWPTDHIEKQASRTREELHNMGSMNMSEICTELKKQRSLVRVCEIQATLREQRVLFLRQQIKELDKLKNQNSFMV